MTTDEERDRRLSIAEMDAVDLGIAYTSLGNAWRLFGPGIRRARPDSCEAELGRLDAIRKLIAAEEERIAEEIFEANAGVTNDGPDRWGSL